jgi:DNA-binding transcriptional LysR family regulator
MRGASLRQLRAFAAVARHRSFVRAAAELNLTPSAVSLQIKELEQSVGFALFSRGNRGVLTRAGELLLADVNRALLALKDAEDTVNQLQGSETGTVSIGFLTNAAYFMPRILAQYHADHPGVELRISVGNREQLTRRLGDREIDICIMGAPPGGLKTQAAPLATQPFGIVASSHDPLSAERRIPVSALAERVFLVRESGSGTRAAMERFLKDAHVPSVPVMEISSNEAIKQSVIAQLGATSRSVIRPIRCAASSSILAHR